MLRMTPSVSPAGTKKYFKQAYSRGEYYTQQIGMEQETPGVWGGVGAQRLGLEGVVKQQPFYRMCDNKHPKTAAKLTPRTKTNRRIGYDINFHVPKSASALAELGIDRRIVKEFERAVDETMREMEKEMQTRVRRDGRQDSRETGNMVWARFTHFTARPVDGIPDPHLHAHCFAFNATWDPVEDRWKAGEFGDLKRDSPYFQEAFYARFASGLVGLGYEIEHTPDGWEIKGIPESVRRAFSRRTEEIERLAEELGIEDANRKAALGARTRKKKQQNVSMNVLRSEWLKRLTTQQREAIVATCKRSTNRSVPEIDTDEVAKDCLVYAREHAFSLNSALPTKRFVAEALKRGIGMIRPSDAWLQLHGDLASGAMLDAKLDGQQWVTTPSVLEEEQSMLTTIRDGRGTVDPLNPEYVIGDPQLSTEQRHAVLHALGATDTVISIRGRAGVGKTRTMHEVVRGIEAAGRQVFVIAPTAMATHEVLRGDGFGNAQTLAMLLKNEGQHDKLNWQVIWLDEAGLASIPDLQKLVALAKAQDARLLLTGDTRQHRSVMRGDALRLIESEAGIRSAELKEVRRQVPKLYKQAVEHLARDEFADAFTVLDRMGSIREYADGEPHTALAEAYFQSINAGRSTLVVAPTHAEGRVTTDAIREKLKTEQLIASQDHVVDRLVSRHLSEAQKAIAHNYRTGDVLEFAQAVAGGYRRGDRAYVQEVIDGNVKVVRQRDGKVGGLPTKHPDRFEVYERKEVSMAVGDRLRVTRNGKSADKNHRLNNGAIYTVAGLKKDGGILLDNGWALPKGFGHINHGYCVTSDASQGRTVHHTIIAQSAISEGASSSQQFYTSVTRGKYQVTIFTDDKERLFRSIQRDASRVTATELVRHSLAPPRQRGLKHRRSIGMWMSRVGHRTREMAADLRRVRGRQRERSQELGELSRER